MLTLNEAFLRLRKDGEFVENINDIRIRWFWHSYSNGFRIMARRDLTSEYNVLSLIHYPEFHINDNTIQIGGCL